MSDNDLDSQRATGRLFLFELNTRTRRLRPGGRVPIGVTSAVGARDRRRPAGFHTDTPTQRHTRRRTPITSTQLN